MWKELEPQILPLTPELAKQHNSRPHLKGDRDFESTTGKRRCEWLFRKVESGEFYTPCWAIAEYHGQWYRVDGGHSSAVLASANGHFPASMNVFVRRFRCETYEDLLALFNLFDNRKSVRTGGDKIKVHKSAHEELDDVSPTAVGDALAGILCYLNDGESKRCDDDERTALVHSETTFMHFAGPFVRNKTLRRPGAIACLYRGFLADPTATAEFWTMVRDETAPEPNHPTRVLARYLRELIGRTGAEKGATARIHSLPRAQYVKSIHAWNAWQKRATTDLKYHESAAVPDMVLLTLGKFRKI